MQLAQQIKMRQSQSLVMTPQLQQAIKLLQMTNIELCQFLDNQTIENPFLENTKLSVKETEKVLRWIEKLKAEGTTCIFITHNLHHVYPVSDRLVVFARGEKIADLQKENTDIQELTNLLVNG